jgi:DNA-binding Lrp family transcriptional regulator
MRAYVDLQKILKKDHYNAVVDLMAFPHSTNTMRAERLGVSPQVLWARVNRLVTMGLAAKLGYNRYTYIHFAPEYRTIKTCKLMDSKVNYER